MIALIRNNRVLFASLGVLLVAALGYFLYSGPSGFPAALRTAAQNRDTIRLEQLVDFAAVRDGLKSDLKAQLATPASQPAAAAAVASAAVVPAPAAIDQTVDQVVTAQGLEQVIANPPGTASAASQLLDEVFPKDRTGQRFRVDHHYLAFDRFRYTLTSTGGKSSVDVDLQRQGLFGWRVARVTSNLDPSSLRAALAPPASAAQEPAQEDSQALSSAPPPSTATADNLPTEIGQCVDTTVKAVSTRLDGVADSGSAISFTNGGYQVSYDQVPAVDQSRAGDPIDLCLVSVPDDCPPGDDRGKTYKATNSRTGGSWTLPDSEHMCGGA